MTLIHQPAFPVFSFETAERLFIVYSSQGASGVAAELQKLRNLGVIWQKGGRIGAARKGCRPDFVFLPESDGPLRIGPRLAAP